jgi:O-antigen/teichoic acid export membrane protein
MNGWIVLILLLVATIPHATSKILTNVVLSMGHAWHILSLNMIWAVVLLIVSFWLIPSMGGLGLSIALLLAYVVLSIGLLLLIYMILKSNHEINQ